MYRNFTNKDVNNKANACTAAFRFNINEDDQVYWERHEACI
uniref:Uncharacterized protein n=1 Tax=Anguilla anguilla TaxID=7936 RepID=A0A0E9UVK9_ANGAN